MKILDCTLRDGGFVNNFNWNIEFAKRYFPNPRGHQNKHIPKFTSLFYHPTE
jgi:hypothetical protein